MIFLSREEVGGGGNCYFGHVPKILQFENLNLIQNSYTKNTRHTTK